MRDWNAVFLIARADSKDQADMHLFKAMMVEAVAEAQANALRGGHKHAATSSGDEDEQQGDARVACGAPVEDDEDEHHRVLHTGPWGRRQLGDDWYELRCVRCSACQRPINASVRSKRGQRCVGCLQWFHDACVPPGTLPATKALREGDPTTSDYFCSASCARARALLVEQAASALGPSCKTLADGTSKVCLVDCHQLRQYLSPEPHPSPAEAADERSPPGKQQRSRARVSSSSEPFQRIAREELRASKRLGQPLRSAISGGSPEAGAAHPWPNTQAHGTAMGAGLAGLRAVTKIFNSYDKTESEKDLLQDGWVAVLRRGPEGRAVSAASLVVFGQDHARLQGLVTLPAEQRSGHARLLVSELQAWLRASGVPRLVAVLPEQRTVPASALGREEDGGEGVLRKLGFSALQDLEVLGGWKQTHYPYYTKELLGRRPRVLTTPTAMASGRWTW